MANFKYKTRGNSNPQGKPRVYFCCHPEDFNRYFESISNEILSKQNCAIWYTDEVVAKDEDFFIDLKQMQLFVMPVTTNLLCTENDAMDIEFKFAVENHIPVLPLMQESGLEELFNKKCGDLQFLDKNNTDETAISYDDKLQKYLEAVLIGDELAEKIRAAFDAYVFLSYRKKDRKYAQELMRLIHKNEFCRDIAIWYDEFLTPGENFNDSIKEALQKSGLFVLAVTPNLINEQNYIMTTEYPMAKREGKPILPAELVPTDREILVEKYEDIPNPADAYNDAELSKALLDSIKIMNIKENDISPEHNFFIGLAYLGGVDVEVDRKRALELITMAAEENLPEAMAKLISMYSDGVGVERDPNEVQKWSKRLAEYYFNRIISKKGTIKSKNKLYELFSYYEDELWKNTIKCFLILVDECLEAEIINELFSLLMQLNFCEYTLFFEACKGMLQHKEVAQRALLMDIMQKSINGIYPPYGPLFWYVPKYGLYEQLLMILNDIEEKSYFTKALALTRDVCWIFGRYNTSYEITNRIDGNDLFSRAELYGVRRSLCELFFTGTVTEECGDDVYPRCFNIAEAKHWKEQRQGVYGRMPQAFEDELGLYTHEMFSEVGGEYIGVVAAPYDRERLETTLSQKSCKKLCGLFFSPTTEQNCEILAVNTNHLKTVYVPENTLDVSLWWNRKQGIYISEKGLLYFYDTVCLPDGITEFGSGGFSRCYTLSSISIPDGVTEINKYAFIGCSALKSVTISKSVKKIAYCAFKDCSSLESIIIPDGVTEIGESAFEGCVCLSSITIPKSVTKFGFRAFKDCSSIVSVIILDGVKYIQDYAFTGCKSLESITLPESVTDIGFEAFKNCRSLALISIPNSVANIGSGAFSGCTSLSSIIIPDSIQYIGEKAFSSCSALESIIIPDGVPEIKESAFEGCISLNSIILPKSVKIIGRTAFKDCSSLESITIPNSVTEIGERAFEGCECMSAITIPNSVTELGLNAFSCCTALKKISNCPPGHTVKELGLPEDCVIEFRSLKEEQVVLNVPDGVTKVTGADIQNRHTLRTVILPNSVKKIRWGAFSGCSFITSITIPDNVTSIEDFTFSGCRSLKAITLPDGVKSIGRGAFSDCKALESITIPNGVKCIEYNTFEGCSSLASITIPNSVRVIEGNAFKDCSSLKSIIIPNDVVEIGYFAFEGCSSLTSITIPNRVKEIGTKTFKDCSSLKSITIPDGVMEIGDSAFYGCSSLASITIPNSVVKIASSAFDGCSSLSSITIPKSVKEINNSVFKDCSSLESIIIPDVVQDIGVEAFSGCGSLESIVVPHSVKYISNCAFQDCSSLASFVIPDSIKYILSYTFMGCISLSSITIPASVKYI